MEIRTLLQQGPVLFDGAMGTYYAALGHADAARCELANLRHPEVVEQIHRAYLEAGCQAIKTNTFGANRETLGCDQVVQKQVLQEGWRLASRAAKPWQAVVFADIGPIPGPQEFGLYWEMVEILLQEGARHFLFETFSEESCLPALADAIKERCPEAFVLTSFAVGPDGFTRQGVSGLTLARRMAECASVDAVGFNCVSGPGHLLQWVRQLPPLGKPLSVMPNAGYPTVVGSRTFFSSDTEYFAGRMVEIAQAGAVILGGCCGTTPDFLRQTARRLRQEEILPQPVRLEEARQTALPKDNLFAGKLARGQRVIAVELDPPLDGDGSAFVEGARQLRDAGVDAITIADCPIARPRVDSSLLACKLKRELGVTPLPHMTCRDRNLNATKALLLGLHMEGVDNVLVVTGDPIPTAERAEVKSVFNFHSRMLARYITQLNQQEFADDPFFVLGALNVNAPQFEVQLRLAREKLESGVGGFLTQPVLSPQAVENLQRAHEELKAPILGGIMPVVSYRNACFMDSEIAGIRVSEEIREMYRDKDKEECRRLAVEVSVRMARAMAPWVQGFYLITPFRRTDIICDILRELEGV
ncbi:MAG: bifunctional homocysteine S-methyltransferase/methylenetetrahydrofolate reductase [Eubacteriales bacterium]|jgi:methionine synthase I (cobalamin-dependent)/5,10-methylenetetrahydrofolate reductase